MLWIYFRQEAEPKTGMHMRHAPPTFCLGLGLEFLRLFVCILKCSGREQRMALAGEIVKEAQGLNAWLRLLLHTTTAGYSAGTEPQIPPI